MSQTQSLTFGTLHNQIARLSPLKANMLAFVCGVITLFAFAPFQFWPVYLISISLLVWLVDGARLREKWRGSVFIRGWLFGAGFTLSSMHWLAAPFLVEPEKHLIFIWMPLILMPAGLGLLFGGATLLAGFFWSRAPGRIFVFTLAFCIFEFIRGVLFGGFPWNWPGMIWAPGQPISQLASIGGLFGLSILTVLFAASPAALADFRPHAGVAGRVFPVFLSVIIFVTGWGWGSQRLTEPASDDVIAVRLIDVGVPQTDKFPENVTLNEFNANAERILRAYLEAMGDDFPDEPRLVIWPEAPIPQRYVADRDTGGLKALPLIQDPNALDAISERLGNRALITGTPRIERLDASGAPADNAYNSLAVLTARSKFRGALAIYDKRKLVPFGEMAAADFIPFGHQISGILPKAMQQQAKAGYKPGERNKEYGFLIELPTGEKFLPLICYEALFPELVRQDVLDADFLVNISIDYWFGGEIGPKQHFAHASYRSIEVGRPMLRVANLGVTSAIDSYGRQIKGSEEIKKDNDWPVLVNDVIVPKSNLITTYNLHYPLVLGLLFTLLILCSVIFRKT